MARNLFFGVLEIERDACRGHPVFNGYYYCITPGITLSIGISVDPGSVGGSVV